MLCLRAKYRGDTVICSKAHNCTFIKVNEHANGDGHVQYYTETNAHSFCSNVSDTKMVAKFLKRKLRFRMAIINHPLIEQDRLDIEELMGVNFAIVVHDRLWYIAHSRGGSYVYVSGDDTKNVRFSVKHVGDRHAPDIAFADLNRHRLYVYDSYGKLLVFNMIKCKEIEPIYLPDDNHAYDDTSVQKITVDPHGNFLCLYNKGDHDGELRVYNSNMKLINTHTLRNIYAGCPCHSHISAFVHHPTQNRLFITTEVNNAVHTTMLSTHHRFAEIHCSLFNGVKSIIILLLQLMQYHTLHVPTELCFIIFEYLYLLYPIDLTGNDKRQITIDSTPSTIAQYY